MHKVFGITVGLPYWPSSQFFIRCFGKAFSNLYVKISPWTMRTFPGAASESIWNFPKKDERINFINMFENTFTVITIFLVTWHNIKLERQLTCMGMKRSHAHTDKKFMFLLKTITLRGHETKLGVSSHIMPNHGLVLEECQQTTPHYTIFLQMTHFT